MKSAMQMDHPASSGNARGGAIRAFVIAAIAFFTVVDLFATQAILPILAEAYRVSPGQMAIAVNATTLGMAAGGLLVALFGRVVDRKIGVVVALVLLAIPTALLAHAPNLMDFALLRVAQGLCMSAAFGLMLAHLGEACTPVDAAGAFAAYITGNVASNLIGRLVAASVSTGFGLASNFYLFALLNLAGAVLAAFTIHRVSLMATAQVMPRMAMSDRLRGLTRVPLLAAFGIGFCILFSFIGVFSYVNFVLVQAPLALSMMSVGLVYFVFVPSIIVTPQAGRLIALFGTRSTLWLGLGLAVLALPLLLADRVALVLLAMSMVGVGTFLAQATATGYVNRTAEDRASASGIYLAAYFSGGLVGTAVLGVLFDRTGWIGCVAGVAVALVAGMVLVTQLDRAPLRPWGAM